MAVKDRPPHDRALFEVLVSHMREVDPEVRAGAMFGAPALFVGARLAFCVYGDAVGAKLPAAEAGRLIAEGQAVAFRPYGRNAMAEWIELRGAVETMLPALTLALRYAGERRVPVGSRTTTPRGRRQLR